MSCTKMFCKKQYEKSSSSSSSGTDSLKVLSMSREQIENRLGPNRSAQTKRNLYNEHVYANLGS